MTDKERLVGALRETGREGIEKVIEELEKLGFFEAPASTRFHGCEPGGLLKHSLGVYDEALAIREVQIRLRPDVEAKLPLASVAISALLHDVCKAEVYKPSKKNRKNAQGKWEEYDTYTVDYSGFPMGHGEKSVIRLLNWGLKLTEDEMLAIRWHMGGWDVSPSAESRGSIGEAGDKAPLVPLIMAADGLASHILEG